MANSFDQLIVVFVGGNVKLVGEVINDVFCRIMPCIVIKLKTSIVAVYRDK